MLERSSLLSEIDRHFLAPEALARVRHFGRSGRDADGWFKGELAYLFATLVSDGALTDWRANVPITEGRSQRCDFRLVPDRTPLWLEVKALPQGGGPSGRVDPGFFLQKGGPGDITEDLVKLMRVPDGETAVAPLRLPPPRRRRLGRDHVRLRPPHRPHRLQGETALSDYPPELYVCKLSLSGGF